METNFVGIKWVVQLFKSKLGRYLKPVQPTKIIIINNNYNNTEPVAVCPADLSLARLKCNIVSRYNFQSSNSPKLF